MGSSPSSLGLGLRLPRPSPLSLSTLLYIGLRLPSLSPRGVFVGPILWLYFVITYFGALYKQKKNLRKRENTKYKKIKKCWKKIKKYINEKNIPECPGNDRRLVQKDQIFKIKKNLTVYFRLMKALLARKILFEEENSKLDV
jgi:hypothetical protein